MANTLTFTRYGKMTGEFTATLDTFASGVAFAETSIPSDLQSLIENHDNPFLIAINSISSGGTAPALATFEANYNTATHKLEVRVIDKGASPGTTTVRGKLVVLHSITY
jgi:hypothetical protein